MQQDLLSSMKGMEELTKLTIQARTTNSIEGSLSQVSHSLCTARVHTRKGCKLTVLWPVLGEHHYPRRRRTAQSSCLELDPVVQFEQASQHMQCPKTPQDLPTVSKNVP